MKDVMDVTRPGQKYPAPEFRLFSTAEDLRHFGQMMLDGGKWKGQANSSFQAGGRYDSARNAHLCEPTDVIEEPGLPFRRLLFAGVNADKWFVHYEHGGIGHGYSVVVFQLEPGNRVHFLWGGAGFRGARNLPELRQMVAAGQFSDELPYSW